MSGTHRSRPDPAMRRSLAAGGFGAAVMLVLALVLTEPAAPDRPRQSGEAQAATLAPVPAEPRQAEDRPVRWDPDERVDPVSVSVPRIGVRSSLIGLGLRDNGSVETPPVETPMQAGWYEPGPAPGEAGPAVIIGHVDGRQRPGVFYRLGELEPGDEILVARADSSVLRFEVDRVREVPKSAFPTREVYGPRPDPELRLISCTGPFDRSAASYRNNIIVFAHAQTPEESATGHPGESR